ncbi:hypothetical protein ACFY1U_32950 [Streptomyces sp. NPDC001351]|uniref:hypothetical protein n=1 Tax=Streptomyces sp. NPDC001351 TaxID=3364564 RepID=UPI0036D13084
MSIPWQRYADVHARTVVTMTAAFLLADFLLSSGIRTPGARRQDAAAPDPGRGFEVGTRPPPYPTAP